MEVLDDLNAVGFTRGVGPGVYDIHSPARADVDGDRGLVAHGARRRCRPTGSGSTPTAG